MIMHIANLGEAGSSYIFRLYAYVPNDEDVLPLFTDREKKIYTWKKGKGKKRDPCPYGVMESLCC